MSIWFYLALGSALTNSLVQAFFNYVVSLKRFSKSAAVFWYSLIASAILFFSLLIIGLPHFDRRFWSAIAVTAVINSFTGPVLLKAYELGEFSSVYSMVLLTPVFSLLISAIFIGEIPKVLGVAGVLLTVLGLYLVSKNNNGGKAIDFRKGNLLGILVSFLWAISTIFDKKATLYSNPFFAPAVGLLIISLANGAYWLFVMAKDPEPVIREKTLSSGAILLLALGTLFALSNILHNAALATGFVAYTLAIKRMGVLLGVFWGWLFFKEKYLRRKLLGAAVAVAGVAAILFA